MLVWRTAPHAQDTGAPPPTTAGAMPAPAREGSRRPGGLRAANQTHSLRVALSEPAAGLAEVPGSDSSPGSRLGSDSHHPCVTRRVWKPPTPCFATNDLRAWEMPVWPAGSSHDVLGFIRIRLFSLRHHGVDRFLHPFLFENTLFLFFLFCPYGRSSSASPRGRLHRS